ncbi:MAG: transcriptional regulator [Burkholderiales bacterium]|jgi:nitrogen regulatory protein P-II 2
MQTHDRKLLTIITEAAIERALIADAKRFGAHGYTVLDVRGGGPGGEREGAWEADRSIELQVVCGEDVATRIAEHVLAQYAPNYAVALYLSDVQVFRAQKY